MYILGINISHHSSIALLKDGELVYFLEEERLNKVKHGVYLDPNTKKRYLTPINSGIFNLNIIQKITTHIDEIVFTSYMETDSNDDFVAIKNITSQLKDLSISYGNVTFQNSHHVYHAMSGIFQSGFKEATCLILDGAGSYLSEERKDLKEVESIYSFSQKKGFTSLYKHYSNGPLGLDQNFNTFKQDNCEIVYSNSFSCGQLFNKMAIPLGFEEAIAESGKLMGLSSYGKIYRYPENWYVEIENQRITNNPVIERHFDRPADYYNTLKKANICKKIQEETLEHTIFLIKKALNLNKSKNLILSGGYFLNCVNNYRYLDHLPSDIKIYIDPISNDNGTALGAAAYIWYNKSKKLVNKSFNNLYLGPQYSKDQLLEGIQKYI